MFFPLYNEEKNVKPLVDEALKVFSTVTGDLELILVNDGSKDKTLELCLEEQKKDFRIKVVDQKNMGYGGAVKTGFRNAAKEWVFFSDGDLQFDLSEIEKFLSYSDTHDFIIGYRKNRVEGFKRRLLASALRVWGFVFLKFPFYIKDIDCAFKLLKREKLLSLGELFSQGGLVSTEFLLKAHLRKFRIKQVGVSHYARKFGNSSGSDLKVVLRAVKETFVLAKALKTFDAAVFFTIFATVFLVGLPLASNINYQQNDDYTHYRIVENFLRGDFSLHPYITATFYAQGLLGALWASIFGLAKLPVLTVLVSAIGVGTFGLITYKFYGRNIKLSFLLAFAYVTSPLVVYSSFGFMTEAYFMFFLLISFYFAHTFFITSKPSDLALTNIFIWLGYFVRQLSIAVSLAFTVALLFRRQYKTALIQLFATSFLLFFHFYIFPQTYQMKTSTVSLLEVINLERIYNLLRVFIAYLGVFLFPFFVSGVFRLKIARKTILPCILLLGLLFVFSSMFDPSKILMKSVTQQKQVTLSYMKPDFPYLGNIFGRSGFIEGNFEGVKYHFPGFFDLFTAFELLGTISFYLFVVYLVFKKPSGDASVFLTLFMFFSFSLLLFAGKYYDRYLIIFLPAILLYYASALVSTKRILYPALFMYSLFMGILSYQYLFDYHLVNKYVWNKAMALNQSGITKGVIKAEHSWIQLNLSGQKNWQYIFSYPENDRLDSSTSQSDFEIVETYSPKYPLNFYIDPKVHLLKKKNLN